MSVLEYHIDEVWTSSMILKAAQKDAEQLQKVYDSVLLMKNIHALSAPAVFQSQNIVDQNTCVDTYIASNVQTTTFQDTTKMLKFTGLMVCCRRLKPHGSA